MENALLKRSMNLVKQRKAADIYPFLEVFIAKREKQVAEIEQSVQRYEIRRSMEERAYQSMSTLRRMISGKKPDHHMAVEYIHYIKRPMEQVRKLRLEIEEARAILENSKPTDLVLLSDELGNELE